MRGFPGQVTNNSAPFEAESMILEKSHALFGVVLVSDVDGLCRLPDKDNILEQGASTGVAVGVVVLEKANDLSCSEPLKLPIGNGETNYAREKTSVSLMRQGSIFVKSETDVNRNDAVFYRVTSSDVGNLGAIRNDADGGKAVKLNGAVFVHGASAGDTVEIALNLNTVQENY